MLPLASLVRAVTIAISAEGILHTQRRKRRATVLQENLGVIRSSKVCISVDTVIVVKEGDSRTQKVALVVDRAVGLELFIG